MASKVLVKIPTIPFSQVNKKIMPELAALGRSDGLMVSHSSDPLLRVTQLEQNIRFLQEQHKVMLSSLFQEVEQLRQRNRDLQFQLVFSKGGIALVQSSPTSSPEDDPRPKILLSPKQFNLTPLQVEILERDITELKATLHEAKTKNVYLSGIVEEQKKKLEKNEEERLKLEAVGHHISPVPKHVTQELAGPSSLDTESESLESADELTIKLEEAEQMIQRLRIENDDQKKELITLKTNLSKSYGGGGGGRQLGGGGNHRGGGVHHHHQHHRTNSVPQPTQTNRFPPLHTQSYWHNSGGQQPYRGGMEFSSTHRRGVSDNTSFEKENQLVGRPAPSLPNLRGAASSSYSYGNTNHSNTSHTSTNQAGVNQGNNTHQQRRGGYYNGNHYYRGSKDEGEGGNRKYRGGRGGTRGSRDSKE